MVIEFKSNEDNYIKEHSGKKSNTVRLIDDDERFKKLWKMQMSGDYGKIKIINSNIKDCSVFFVRQITDCTFWKDVCIISWSTNENDENGGKF